MTSQPLLGFPPPCCREPRSAAAAEGRPATRIGPGIAEIRALVGGLIRQGRPLPVLLSALCQLFDTSVKGYSSSVLLLDHSGTRVQNAIGPGLPTASMKLLEGRRVSWIDAPFAAAPGLRLHEVSPILSLTGESLGIFAVYQRQTWPDGSRTHSGLMARFTHVASAAIERTRSDDALAKLRAEFVRATRVTSLGVLTAAIAHEVNQPLAGIVTNAGTCRRMLAVDPPDIEGARETARRMIRDAERAAEIVKRLRALFCKKDGTCESLDLNEATREVMALALPELERNKVLIRTELAGKLPSIQGDRVQLQQVILNLVLNAADAMSGVDDRPRELLIRTEPDAGERVRVSVRDTGVGLEPQGVDRLFDAFYTTKSTGMGIGLSVSRSIIESHKGRLWANPNEGPGATFTFCLPCEPKAECL